jgi:D-arginine dehydrogenase
MAQVYRTSPHARAASGRTVILMRVNVVVVGGGIAGVSVAAELSRDGVGPVALLEGETQLAYHASGRSAATFLESYGSPEIRALTRASRPMFGPGVLSPRPLLWLAHADGAHLLEQQVATEPLVRAVDEAAARALFPALRPEWVAAAAVEDDAQDMDVAALFDQYRRVAVGNGVKILTGARVRSGTVSQTGWVLRTETEDVEADIVVNAAGAWADELARACGLPPLGLMALRRTVAVASCPPIRPDWPLLADIAESFYLRPEGDGVLISPADETPVDPGDARAEMEDVALALERVNEATTLDLRHVRTSWAGLRTFAPDRNPVVGFDPACPSFFWVAGQGGYGMQTAPAIAVLAASLIRGEPLPEALVAAGVDPAPVSPARLRTGKTRV